MADFNFIIIPELRQCLENDYKELRACLNVEAWKAVHVLAGSIVEAVLIDALSGPGVDQDKLDSKTLAELILRAKEEGILADEAEQLSTVIRKFRNLIHPGRSKRLEKTVDRSGAIVAAEVVEIVTKQVAKRKQETYGYTAEQLFERLRGGSSALPLVAHLLSDTKEPEIERLLISVLPTAFFESIEDPNSSLEDDRHLTVCYRKVLDAAPLSVKTKVAKNLYKIYRTEPEARVVIYEDHFFKGSDLTYLSENEQVFIKAHFLPRVSVRSLGERLSNTVGIGPFLTPEEAGDFSSKLLVAMQGEDTKLAERARFRLVNEYPKMTADCRRSVRDMASFLEDSATLAKLELRERKIKQEAQAEATSG